MTYANKKVALPQTAVTACRIHHTGGMSAGFAKLITYGLITLLFSIVATGPVIAQQPESISSADDTVSGKIYTQSINMCPLAIAFGIYSVNYEHLFNQTHGVVARIEYESISETYSDDPINANGVGFSLNYRWHWSGGMESWFLGAFARYRMYNGDGTSGQTDFNFEMREFTLGANVGKRWVWNSGFNITFAFGYGFSTLNKETEPTSTSIETLLNTFEDEYTFLGPFMGEFSIGYAF